MPISQRDYGGRRLSSPFLDDPILVTEAADWEATSALDAADAPVNPEEEEVPFALPATAAGLPTDAAMRSQLQANGSAQARALDLAFASFGDFGKFVNRLPVALKAVYEPLKTPERRYFLYLARLGAEAFVYDAPRIEPDHRFQPWIDYPDINQSPTDPSLLENFVHFAVRRLHQICRIATRPQTHRRQIDRAGALLRFLQVELARQFRLAIASEAVLLEYRALLVRIVWLHYQLLLDGWLATAAKSRLADSVTAKEWPEILRLAVATYIDDAQALVPTFNLTATLYRDYFDQKAATDIGYRHYTATSPPFTGHGPDMPFTTVLRRRVEQKALIDHLRRQAGSGPLPGMHDSGSWQVWLRNLWDRPQLRREGKLALVLDLAGRYFQAFTIHSPHDLREGCSEKNYLLRVFPRAITGALVHDCFVYACRWVHILGRLLTPGATPEGIVRPRVFLVEMPAHVGVMIRADTALNRHVVIGINNKDARIHEIDAGETDEEAAKVVVHGMYRGMKTPFVVRRLTSKLADANSLWSEACKLSEKKLTLPYSDATNPPHLRYLRHNDLVARVGRDFTNQMHASWATLRQNLDRAGAGRGNAPGDLARGEIRKHAERFEAAIKSAWARIESETKPLIKEINDDLNTNRARIPKGVLFADTGPEALFSSAVSVYRRELEAALRSGDASAIDPAQFFPENDFTAALE